MAGFEDCPGNDASFAVLCCAPNESLVVAARH